MQAFLPSSLIAAVSPLPAPGPAAPAHRPAADKNDNSFSRQLEQSRQSRAQESARPAAPDKPAAPPPAPDKAAAAPRPAPAEPPAKAEGAGKAGPSAAREGKARTRTDTATPAARAQAEADSASAAQAKDNDGTDIATNADTETEAKSALTDPALLAGLLPAAMAPEAASKAAEAEITALPAAAVPPTETPPPALAEPSVDGAERLIAAGKPQPGPAGLDVASTAPAEAGKPTASTELRDPNNLRTAEGGSWQQAQAAAMATADAQPLREPGAESSDPSARSPASPALGSLGGWSSTLAQAGRPGDVPAAHLATPATSAEFRAALGSQVSYFARAGVQQAELHLNPADMGPVSIQIVIEGQQAQVNFGADSALTRQIIESGMPELAGALRDAGLTLTGGGVSQHAGGQRQDPQGQAATGGAASGSHADTASDGAAPAPAEQVRRSAARGAQGGLDLYA